MVRTAFSTLLVLCVIGALYLFFSPILPGGSVVAPEGVISPSDAPGYHLYTDANRRFTFAFPSNLVTEGYVSSDARSWSSGSAADGSVLAEIRVPQSYDPGTNFGGAVFSVGTSADPSAIISCLSSFGDENAPIAVTIGGIEFVRLSYAGAAAGNRYDTTSYRTIRNNECWAVEYTIHYGNIQNYPAGLVKEFDEARMVTALDEIARSFQFLGR